MSMEWGLIRYSMFLEADMNFSAIFIFFGRLCTNKAKCFRGEGVRNSTNDVMKMMLKCFIFLTLCIHNSTSIWLFKQAYEYFHLLHYDTNMKVWFAAWDGQTN